MDEGLWPELQTLQRALPGLLINRTLIFPPPPPLPEEQRRRQLHLGQVDLKCPKCRMVNLFSYGGRAEQNHQHLIRVCTNCGTEWSSKDDLQHAVIPLAPIYWACEWAKPSALLELAQRVRASALPERGTQSPEPSAMAMVDWEALSELLTVLGAPPAVVEGPRLPWPKAVRHEPGERAFD